MHKITDLLPTLNTCDSIIKSIALNPKLKEAEVIIQARNSANDWVNVRFLMKDMQEFKIYQAYQTTLVVISDGIFYKNIENLHCIDFSTFTHEPTNLNDFRQSECYFFAKDILAEILPYDF